MCRMSIVILLTSVVALSAYAQNKSGAVMVDASLPDQSRSIEFQFYHRASIGTAQPGQPPEYVRGIRVKESSPNFRVLDSWEAQPTTIVAFDQKLNRTWVVGRAQIITATVYYGGRYGKLFALYWTGGKLKQVNEWDGAGFSIRAIGSPPEPVVAVNSSDYSRVPELYAWNGTEFQAASDRFPAYFASLGADYAAPIYDYSHPVPPVALLQSCRLSLEAYKLAHNPDAGHKACLEARDRISEGRGIIPGATIKAEDFQRQRSSAIAEIDSVVKQ
jgi:hypothetical protein